MDRGAGGTGDDTDGTGKGWQWLLVSRIKESLGGQLFLELLKSRMKITDTVHGHGGAIKLIGTVSGKHRNLAHGNDFHAVFRSEPKPHGIALKHDASQRAVGVFQSKVMMTGGILLIVADLPPNGQIVQNGIRIHPAADVFVDLGNGKHFLCHMITPGWLGSQRPWRCR